MKKLTRVGISFAILMIFLCLIGCYDFLMVITRNQAYFAQHYSPAVKTYFTHYPVFFFVLWIGSLLSGVLAPIFHLFRSKLAYPLAGFAFWADALLIIVTCLFRNRIQVFGRQFFVDLTVLVLMGIYYWYLHGKIDGELTTNTK